MPDYFGPRVSGPKPDLPPGYQVWRGLRLPPRKDGYGWRELSEVAAANGWDLKHDLLKKWRLWRLVPAPLSGGSTGHGRGRGQKWPWVAAVKVAWLSRWLSDTLTYDVLRLSMWPWTPQLERDRPVDILRSVHRFLKQDEDYHDRVLAQDPRTTNPAVSAYRQVLLGEEPSLGARARLLRGLQMDDVAHDQRAMEALRLTNFFEMSAELPKATVDDLRAFIPVFRAFDGPKNAELAEILLDNPIDIARSIVGALHIFMLQRSGRLVARTTTK